MDSQEQLTSLVAELSHESPVEDNLKTVTSIQVPCPGCTDGLFA
jgi:hypothetical protein